MSLFVFFISLRIVAQHISGSHVPIIRSWRLRDVIALCWYVPWLQEGGQVRLAGSASLRTQGYNITQSSASDDGHMAARNMLSNYSKRNKEYKKWHLVGFSYPNWIIFFLTTRGLYNCEWNTIIYVYDASAKKVWERSHCTILHRCLSKCLVLDINDY